MIRLGYELGTGHAVDIPLRHTAVTGQTQESGKTTTLEALITRSGLRAVAFITKRGEKSFRLQTPVAPYFREPALTPESPMWRWVESIFETIGESVGRDDKALLIRCSNYVLVGEKYKVKGEMRLRIVDSDEPVATLKQVAENVRFMLWHARGRDQKTLTCLDAYFKIVMPQIARMRATGELRLAGGINVMDIEGLTTEMQMLIIRSVLETVYSERRSTVVIIPEAWKFIPRMRNSPVRFAAEIYIRQGLALKNILMLDSQDLANIGTEVLKSIGVWILGKQSEINEVKRVVDYIPAIPRIPREAIMQLGKGEFYVVAEGKVKKCYVQPAGMEDLHAQAIAKGEESADSWRQIERKLDSVDRQQREEGDDEEIQKPIEGRDSGGSDGLGDQLSGGVRVGEISDGDIKPRPGSYQEESTALEQENRQLDVRSGCAEPGREGSAEGRPGAAADHGGDGSGDEDQGENDEMWKERAEIAESENRDLRLQISDLKIELANIKARLGDASSDSLTREVHHRPLHAPQDGDSPVETMGIAGFTDAGYAALRARLLADRGVLAALEAIRPEIRVTTERPILSMNSDSNMGRMAMLLHEGFFKNARPNGEIQKEFKRRGWGWGGRSQESVSELNRMGFLVKEDSGYQAVPGMKVTVGEQ